MTSNKKGLLKPKEIEEIIIHKGKWISYGYIDYKDPIFNLDKRWEFARRNNHSNDNVDAVDILAVLKSKDCEDRIVLVSQFRAPAQKYFLEFPAGLVDANESIESTCKRELYEETGYIADKIKFSSMPLFYDPGLSDSNMKLVHVEIDGDLPENNNPIPKPDCDEWSLKSFVIELNNLYLELYRLHTEEGYSIDAKLFSYAYALQMMKNI